MSDIDTDAIRELIEDGELLDYKETLKEIGA